MEPFVFADLEPKNAFRYFEQLCRLPHESHNTAAATAWALDFAREQGLKHRSDEAGNVIIWKSASPGYEDHPAVILQGHLDMVCVQESGLSHDFASQPLDLCAEGDYVFARGTSLGGDNGIAVAMAMAVLADKNIPHPPVVAVFTTDEEVGLLGAAALDCSDLGSRLLINLDSEEEGYLTVSCAGGARCDITGTFSPVSAQGHLCTLSVDGLQGGHSGVEIHKGLANANKVLGRCLQALAETCQVQLVSLFGGLQDNAIPKESCAKFVIPTGKSGAASILVKDLMNSLRAEFAAVEPGMAFSFRAEGASAAQALSVADSSKLIALICGYPDGIVAMSADIEGLVQTSLNLGILRLGEGTYQLSSAIRSSIEAEKAALSQRLQDLAEAYGAAFSQRGAYPGWAYRKDSLLRDTMVQVYTDMYGNAPQIAAIHAGLECGIFADKIADLDAVSIGPNLQDVHSTREKLSISSTQRVWEYLLAVLKAL